MPIKVIPRKSTGALTISGTVRLKDGSSVRVQRRARSDNVALAEEERAALEANILRTDWHGERRGHRSFDEAIVSYLKAKPRSEATKMQLRRIRDAFGSATRLGDIDQDTIASLREKMHAPDVSESTVLRQIITPLRSVLRHAHKRGWCDAPVLESPRITGGRTLYMTPDEAERLLAAAAAHIKPLLTFLIGAGARMSEAIYLEWRDVDLKGARAIFWADRTKSGKRRDAILPPRVVVALANLPHRDGMVFRRDDGEPYVVKVGEGGQIKRAWAGAIARAGLDPEYTPHTLRHSWASWHYALHKDPMRLKVEGGWSSLDLVERYAHLMKDGHEVEIRRWLGIETTAQEMRA